MQTRKPKVKVRQPMREAIKSSEDGVLAIIASERENSFRRRGALRRDQVWRTTKRSVRK